MGCQWTPYPGGTGGEGRAGARHDSALAGQIQGGEYPGIVAAGHPAGRIQSAECAPTASSIAGGAQDRALALGGGHGGLVEGKAWHRAGQKNAVLLAEQKRLGGVEPSQ